MGGIGGGSQKSSSTQNPSKVWKKQIPYLKAGYDAARGNLPMAEIATETGMGWMNQAAGGLQNLLQPGVDPMLGVYAQQIGDQFRNQVMPQLSQQAQLAGGLGSSRQGLAEGVAAGAAQQNLQNFGAQLYGDNANRAMQSAGILGDMSKMYGQMPFSGLQGYAGVIGGPAILGGGGSSSSSGWNANLNILGKG